MSDAGEAGRRIRKPLEDIPVLTEEVDAAALAAGLGPAQLDALVAQIERGVLDDLAPRLEEIVHEAVRAAVERALAARSPGGKAP